MDNINMQCGYILELLRKYSDNYYSIQRIREKVLNIKEAIEIGKELEQSVDFKSYVRHFVDDTGDYSSKIITALENLEQLISKNYL